MVAKGKRMVVASYTDKTKIHELLTKYLHPIENTEFYRYEDGWNDERIAAIVNSKFGFHHAQTVRMEVFGKLKNRGNILLYKTGGTLSVRMEAVEKQIRKLVAYCGCNAEEEAYILSNVEIKDPEDES